MCDENGYVSIENTQDIANVYRGRMTFEQAWKYGNGTKLVAWMRIPHWPENMCRPDADGDFPL